MATGRIHMVTGEPVCVFYYPLLTDIHQNGLTAHGADVVREVLGRHARCAVVLGRGKKLFETLWGHQTGGTDRATALQLTPTVEAMKSAHISAKSLPRTP